jgi:hypothetical protein
MRTYIIIDAEWAQVSDGDDIRGMVEDIRGGFRELGLSI